MKRAILDAPALSPAALAELKDWLGITTSGEDAGLGLLLRAAIESCEAFTGLMPITCTCEEILPVCRSWLVIATEPVHAITAIDGLSASGSRIALPVDAYAVDFATDGRGRVRLLNPGLADRVAVRFSAGLADAWSSLPEGLRLGIVRLAAHLYRQREGESADAAPPAAVAALWRPWRKLRL